MLRFIQLRVQQSPELLLRAVQLSLHRSERQFEGFGEILVLHALQIVRGHQKSVIRRQSRDGFLQAIAKLEIAELPIFRGRQRDRSSSVTPIASRDTVAFRAAPILKADVGDDSVNPGREPGLSAKIGKTAVNAKKHLLREILGLRTILDRSAQSTRTPDPCSDRRVPGTHLRRRTGSARRARALRRRRSQGPSTRVLEHARREIVSLTRLKQFPDASSLMNSRYGFSLLALPHSDLRHRRRVHVQHCACGVVGARARARSPGAHRDDRAGARPATGKGSRRLRPRDGSLRPGARRRQSVSATVRRGVIAVLASRLWVSGSA